MQQQIKLGLVEFRADHTEPPFRKAHIRPVPDELDDDSLTDDESEAGEEELATQVKGSYFYKQSQVAVKYLRKLMGAKLFDNPKDYEEIAKLLRYMIGSNPKEIVLDFFAGSGTTAEAVLSLNRERGTDHRFIIVQLPEPCNPKERTGRAALNAGLLTIADIAKERIRRVIKKLDNDDAGQLNLDGDNKQVRGYRVFKLSESNFKTWNVETSRDAESLSKQLELHVEHIREGRTADDLLYEILLKSGFPLTTPVETLQLAGKVVQSVASGALLVCLDRELTLELIRALAERKPERIVCLDEGFAGNDQLKANAVQIFRTKGVTSFKTV